MDIQALVDEKKIVLREKGETLWLKVRYVAAMHTGALLFAAIISPFLATAAYFALHLHPAATVSTIGIPSAPMPVVAPAAAPTPAPTPAPAPEPALALPTPNPEVLAALTHEAAAVKPRLDVDAVMNACENEVGLLCHAYQDRPWSAVRCLRQHDADLLSACRKSLTPDQDVATAY